MKEEDQKLSRSGVVVDDEHLSRFGAFTGLCYVVPVMSLLGLILWIGYHAFTKGT